jgi:hypothetical protein
MIMPGPGQSGVPGGDRRADRVLIDWGAGWRFAAVSITATHQVADGLHSAIIRAVRP